MLKKEWCEFQSIKHRNPIVINVTKAAQLSADVHRYASVLVTAVTCGGKFATKVLNAIKTSDVTCM